ncbi:MAG: DUF3369 domain-containing protein [Spirochaetales bacterium]|nr:DUF3369 domain-containing protein [Spirochaetales bacterium]
MESQNQLVFEDESDHEASFCPVDTWKLLIVDDEEDVHVVTSLVLRNMEFMGKTLEILRAYSAGEAQEILSRTPGIAAALIDVVMETERAGLELVKWIRTELGDHDIRLILRTGQPGYAPEKEVIIEYDINDYKEKTELTSQKLHTSITTALRSYGHLKTLSRSESGLHQILDASKTLFDVHSVHAFVAGVLTQLTALLKFEDPALYVQVSGLAAGSVEGSLVILAGTGEYKDISGKPLSSLRNTTLLHLIKKAASSRKSLFKDNYFIGYFKTKMGSENILCLNCKKDLDAVEKDLIRLFSTHISVAFDNIYLNQEIEDTQEEILYTLSEIVETRSRETGYHAKRVGMMSRLLARAAGMSEYDQKVIALAAPLHDVGKIGIPDGILLKEGRLNHNEFDIIKTHPDLGWEMLKGSRRKILETAAVIALEHHEYWDGSGYPRGLRAENIHPMARIVCVIDVFDALVHIRSYKEAWDYSKAFAFLKQNAGTMFDPALIETFMTVKEEILAVQSTYQE